jgi:excisionase family DNA binding protein
VTAPGNLAHSVGGEGANAAHAREVVVVVTERLTPRVGLTLDEAAESLGISRDTLERHVLADLRVLRLGRRVVVPLAELQRYADRHSSRPLADELEALRR